MSLGGDGVALGEGDGGVGHSFSRLSVPFALSSHQNCSFLVGCVRRGLEG